MGAEDYEKFSGSHQGDASARPRGNGRRSGRLIHFLASDKASWITGATYEIDGAADKLRTVKLAMKLQMLPSTIDEDGRASARQHLMSLIIDDRVAIDAGSLAFSCSNLQRSQVRDVVHTHPHLDHIADCRCLLTTFLPALQNLSRVHATDEIIEIMERDVFNWSVYRASQTCRMTMARNGKS
jgi:hypothetical protein